MSNGGKHLKELIKKYGFRYGAVAEAIGVAPHTMTRWTDNAPIGKLFGIADFTGIPFQEIANCFRPDRESPLPDDRTGGDTN